MRFGRYFASMSKIGTALTVPYLATALLILCLVGGIIYYSYASRISSIEELQSEISNTAAVGIDDYVSSILKELHLTAKNIRCADCYDASDALTLKNTLQSDPSLYEISIATLDGAGVNSVVKYAQGTTSIAAAVDAEALLAAFESQKAYVSKPYVSVYGLPSVLVSVPIAAENGRTIGILSAAVDLSPLWERVSKINFKQAGYAYVVDTTGHLIAYKDVRLVAENLDLSQSGGVGNFLRGAYGFHTYESFTGRQVIGNARPVDTTGWGVIVELPTSEVFRELLPLYAIALVSFILLAVSLLLPVHTIVREILAPVAGLLRGVKALESGDLSYTVKVESRTELGELAASFNEMAARLKEIDRAKSEFVSLASHQLRTPATSINWYSEMLAEVGPLNEKQKEYVREIRHGDQRMISLINSLLNVSRIELGTYSIEPSPISVGDIADDVLNELGVQISLKRLSLTKQYAAGTIESDPTLVRIVIQNLLSNAVAYTPEGGSITVSTQEKGAAGIELTVKDTGYGIPAESQPKMFTRFYRASNARDIRPDGSGLGLYITKSIVTALGGSIGFISTERVGTTFTVALPGRIAPAREGGKKLL